MIEFYCINEKNSCIIDITNVTEIVMKKCCSKNVIFIPGNNIKKKYIFGKKFKYSMIKIIFDDKEIIFNYNTSVSIDLNKLYNLKLINKYFNNKKLLNYPYIYYFDNCDCRNNYNFGDYITPYIYEKIYNIKPINNRTNTFIMGAGSILRFSNKNSIIWGTGFIKDNSFIKKYKNILSVRGPLTRNRLLELGIKCPEVYGDIGLIMPYFFNPKIEKKYKIGIIPHYIDMEEFKNKYNYLDSDIKIIDVTDNIEIVISNILQCEMTISSSLHGIIISHAYNIKSMWIKISDNIEGGIFKFRDYYGSININNYINMNPYIFNKKILKDELIKLIESYPNPKFPLNTKYILDLCPFLN